MVGLRPAPLRPLGVAEILDGAVRLVRRNLRAVLPVSVPYAVVASGATALLQYTAVESGDAATLTALGGLLIAAGLGAVLTGLLTPLYSGDLLGNQLTAGQSLARVGRRGWTLFLMGLVIIVAEGLGLLAVLVGGIWLWGIWAVAAPACVLEGRGVRASLGRSRRLVSGSFWRVWGIRALGALLTATLGQLVALPAELIAAAVGDGNPLDPTSMSHPALYVSIVGAGSLITTALLAPVSAAVDVLLYTDLRMRKEGMDIVLGLPPDPAAAATGSPAVSAW